MDQRVSAERHAFVRAMPSSYDELLSENAALRRSVKDLEQRGRKKTKRPPNAYQLQWALEYKLEVVRAKSVNATAPAEYMGITLPGYEKRYAESMNTSPHPKNGEPLTDADRKMFMRSVAARAKAFNVRSAAVKAGEASAAPAPRRRRKRLRLVLVARPHLAGRDSPRVQPADANGTRVAGEVHLARQLTVAPKGGQQHQPEHEAALLRGCHGQRGGGRPVS